MYAITVRLVRGDEPASVPGTDAPVRCAHENAPRAVHRPPEPAALVHVAAALGLPLEHVVVNTTGHDHVEVVVFVRAPNECVARRDVATLLDAAHRAGGLGAWQCA